MADNDIRQRLAAILAADAVGYSRLMQDNELATVATLDECRTVFRERIEANGGRVVDMAGDSVLAAFETATGAVKAAIESQDVLIERNATLADERRMQFRIGVHLGEVMEKSDGSIYGDGVNVAARLEGTSEPGTVTVSDTARSALRDRMEVGFDFLGDQEVKNIARPVPAYRVVPDGHAGPTTMQLKRRRKVQNIALAAVAFALIAGIIVWQNRPSEESTGDVAVNPIFAQSSGPVIAVLPFQNLSDDSEQDYFAEGISEDIINQLSPTVGIQVTSRNSSFRFRGADVDKDQAGKDLGADFLVVGSVRRAGKQIRVSAELLEVAGSKAVWSEAYSRDLNLAELFSVQEDIAQSIVATIADEYGVISQLARQEDRGGDTSLGSYECVLFAYHYFEYFTEANHLRLRNCLEEAVQRDPEYAEAWGWLAIIYGHEISWGYNPLEDSLGRALVAGNTAVNADRRSQMAWEGKAAAHFFRHERDKFVAAAEKAVDLNPNDVSTIANIGYYYGAWGMYDKSIPLLEKAIGLSPFDVFWYYYPFWIQAFDESNYELALEYAQKSAVPGIPWTHLHYIPAYAHLGQTDKAKEELVNLLEMQISTVLSVRELMSFWNYPESVIDRAAEGFRAIGMPEGQ
jgi:adenylate cyclase